jgi:hypothetical protein
MESKNTDEDAAKSKKYRDDLEKMHNENSTYLSKLNIAHTKEVKHLDSEKTKREKEHLNYQKRANEIFDGEYSKKEEASREAFDNFQKQMAQKEKELSQAKADHIKQMSQKQDELEKAQNEFKN